MLGGTFIQVTGNNIKFSNRVNYTCMFDETEVKGIYFTQFDDVDKILCVSPLLRRIGKIEFTIKYSDPLISIQKTVLVKDTFLSCKYCDNFVYVCNELVHT